MSPRCISNSYPEPLRPAAPVIRIMQCSLPLASVAYRRRERRERFASARFFCVMSKKLLRYRVKPEKIEENQRVIEKVFRELHARHQRTVLSRVLPAA